MAKPRIVVIGSLNMDVVVEADRAPIAGETVLGNQVHFIPGGKGANQAVALARLGAHVSMIGAVGTDAFGQELLRALAHEGIETSGIKVLEHLATGVAAITLAEGDNRIIVVPGANAQCRPEDVDAHEDMIAKADVVLIQLEIPIETVERAVRIAKQQGKIVVLNPAPAQVLSEDLLQQVDYLTPNRSELALLSGVDAEGEQLEEGMNRLLNLGVKTCITTLGEEGAAYKHQSAFLCKVPGHRVQVVDTTGAGDAFNAGLTYAIASDKDIADAVAFASKVSAMAVTKFGAQAGMPSMEDIEAYFGKTDGEPV